MEEQTIQIGEDMTISVERMIQFCYIAQMEFEYASYRVVVLPTHLSRFGTILFQTAGFLYSLFDDRKDSINLLRVWQGFDHPFNDELQNFGKKLAPFKKELKLVRNRIAFHGSLTRSSEKAGLSIFDVESPRGFEFASLIRDMQNLAGKMIKWHVDRMNEADQPMKIWEEFGVELTGYKITRS